MATMRVSLQALIMIALATAASAYEFDMIFQTKCIFEEVSFETSIKGGFKAFQKDHEDLKVSLTIRIENPSGDEVYTKASVNKADFNLNDLEEGEYKICFTSSDYHTAQNTRINLMWDEGVDATDWEMVAKRDNLDSVHTELLRLEESVHNIHLELQHIRRKEEQMRDINEKTNARIAWFSIGALFTCVGMAAFQIWNLRKFFIRKKIL